MFDFNGEELIVGDKVVFALNKHKRTKLSNGIILKTGIKQASMEMALIEYGENLKGNVRVASWNIYKV